MKKARKVMLLGTLGVLSVAGAAMVGVIVLMALEANYDEQSDDYDHPVIRQREVARILEAGQGGRS